MTEHDVETARQEMHTGVPGLPLDDPRPLPDALRLPGERLPDRGDRRRVLLDARHLMAGPGQPQRLRAPAHAHVEHPQPLPHREARDYLLLQLAGHQLLTDDVTQTAGPAQRTRRRRTVRERSGAQGRSPRFT